ncbi:hypothetical protein CAP36_14990 [Chitinophagaceae bacterium IBVUCB2]|nr:hypothetical protein CAP36_14990 [Chitinophagaceae bacterium IBVUCB2]
MKKILLSLSIFAIAIVGNSQAVLNEIYTTPGSGNHEYFELYNSSTDINPLNVDCFTIITYYENSAADKGFFVIDLPNQTVASKGFYVGASSDPFNYQSSSGADAAFSWNNAAFLAANGGSFKKWVIDATPGVDADGNNNYDLGTILAGDENNIFREDASSSYVVMVYQSGVLVNFFRGANSGNTIPDAIRAMPNLFTDMNGGCTDFTINFQDLNNNGITTNTTASSDEAKLGEYVTPSDGTDNGFIRKRDGKCGEWDKASSPGGQQGGEHTPGTSNGAAGTTGSITNTVPFITCAATIQTNSSVNFDITGGPAEAFAVTVQLYVDYPPIGVLSGNDVPGAAVVNNAISDGFINIPFTPKNLPILLVFKTPAGCFDKVVSVLNTCIPLPVSFKSFTATRSNANVMVKWETSTEVNNSGFAVERNVNGTWVQVAFVPSQAAGGNSNSLLAYSFNDLNSNKGVSQYRIKQIDIDAQFKYSEIRSVRGDGQASKIIVYPNPSSDGKVNVVFEDSKVTREVSVMDMSGRLVKQFKGITNNNISIENLTPGIYTLRVFVPATGEQAVQKIVVSK